MGEKSLEKLRVAHDEAPFTSTADVVTRAKLNRALPTFMALANAFSAWEPNRHRAAWEGLRVCGDTLPLHHLVFPSSHERRYYTGLIHDWFEHSRPSDGSVAREVA
jgi:hypothetical protein